MLARKELPVDVILVFASGSIGAGDLVATLESVQHRGPGELLSRSEHVDPGAGGDSDLSGM